MPNEKTYSREFEEWVTKNCEGYHLQMGLDMSHFWLSAFVRLVRDEAAKSARANGWPTPDNPEYGHAFNSICERFGLEK